MTVYRSANQGYYQSNTGPISPSDETIPFPTPELITILTTAGLGVYCSVDQVDTTVATVGNGDNSLFTNTGDAE